VQDLNDLFFFAQVVEHGGFAAAGRALGMQRSKLSRRIGLLEDRLGVRLIQRSTRRFSVTEIGRVYYRHCIAVLVEADAAQEAIDRTRSEPRGRVRLICPVALLHFHVAEMLARFMAANPLVQVQLESSNRRVDVVQEGFDVAIRVGFPPLEESDLVMKTLADSAQRLVASPKLLEGRARPLVPTALNGLPSLACGASPHEHSWCLEGPDGATALIRHEPRMVTDDMAALRAAALHGVGVVQLPTMMVRKDLLEGKLVDALPHWVPRSGIVHALFPSRRGLLPSVRALIDFLAAEFTALGGAEAEYLAPRRKVSRKVSKNSTRGTRTRTRVDLDG
jgi:DNA-binding transcriptional LysR family regulator